MVKKSEEFERDINTGNGRNQNDTVEIPSETFDVLMTRLNEVELLETEAGLEEFAGIIEYFLKYQKPNYEIMREYRDGRNYAIRNLRRKRHRSKSDIRITTPFIQQAAQTIRDFYISIPLQYSVDGEGDASTLDVYKRIDDYNNLAELDFNLAYDLTLGRAFELHGLEKINGRLNEKIYKISPLEMFVIRTADLSQRMILAVYLPRFGNTYYPTIYTSKYIYELEPFETVKELQVNYGRKRLHHYGEVPVVEYRNGDTRQSDFSASIPLQDAYDYAMSDTANYRSDFNDNPFLIQAPRKTLDWFMKNQASMMDANFFALETYVGSDGSSVPADMRVLSNARDTAGDEADKKRLKQNLFGTIGIMDFGDPDMSFGNGLSGTAMKQRLSSMYQIYNRKITDTSEGLQRRWRLIENIHNSILKDETFNSENLKWKFTESIPRDVIDDLIRYQQAGIEISNETKLKQVPLVDDVEAEMKRLENYDAPGEG